MGKLSTGCWPAEFKFNATRGKVDQVVWTKDMGKLVDLTLPDNRVVKRQFLEYVIKGNGIFTEPQGQYSTPTWTFWIYRTTPTCFLREVLKRKMMIRKMLPDMFYFSLT